MHWLLFGSMCQDQNFVEEIFKSALFFSFHVAILFLNLMVATLKVFGTVGKAQHILILVLAVLFN